MVGAGAALMLVSTFALPWYWLHAPLTYDYGKFGTTATITGWDALSVTRWFVLVTGLLGLAVWLAQVARRAPALPVSLTVILMLLSLLNVLLLVRRVVISQPGPSSLISLRVGAVVGLISAIAVFAGAYLSLRRDGLRKVDGPGEIETIRLSGSPTGTA
jgi:hypothetical protein